MFQIITSTILTTIAQRVLIPTLLQKLTSSIKQWRSTKFILVHFRKAHRQLAQTRKTHCHQLSSDSDARAYNARRETSMQIQGISLIARMLHNGFTSDFFRATPYFSCNDSLAQWNEIITMSRSIAIAGEKNQEADTWTSATGGGGTEGKSQRSCGYVWHE